MLDHVAIGVRQWSDAYERFILELGGRWTRGGATGGFAPYQLGFGDCLQLEFMAPLAADGFMRRFLARRGPAPHHITFKVKSIQTAKAELERLGFETFGGGRPDLPMWREAFVHPKQTGLGTLVQIVETDDEFLAEAVDGRGRPKDLPDPPVEPRPIALFGLTVADVGRAHDLLALALEGSVVEKGDDWFLLTWGPGRSILVRLPSATPGGQRLWAQAPSDGVAFVVFGPGDLTAAALQTRADELIRMPDHAETALPVWLVGRV